MNHIYIYTISIHIYIYTIYNVLMYHINILYIMQCGIYTILFAYAILKYTIAAIICYTNLYSWLLYTETNVYIVLEILYVMYMDSTGGNHIWMVPCHCVIHTLRCHQTFENPPLMILRKPAFIGDMPLPSLAIKKQMVQWCSPNFLCSFRVCGWHSGHLWRHSTLDRPLRGKTRLLSLSLFAEAWRISQGADCRGWVASLQYM